MLTYMLTVNSSVNTGNVAILQGVLTQDFENRDDNYCKYLFLNLKLLLLISNYWLDIKINDEYLLSIYDYFNISVNIYVNS